MQRSKILRMASFFVPFRTLCSTSKQRSFSDIVIVGGGLVGSAMSCAIGKSSSPLLRSKQVFLLDSGKVMVNKEPYNGNGYSNRVSAISPSSVRLFEKFGIWDNIKRRAQCISALYIEDGCSGAKISLEQENSRSPIAYIVENQRIVQALQECIKNSCPNLVWREQETYKELSLPDNLGENVHVLLEDGSTVECSLLIAADGANSKVRELSGIQYTVKDYEQMAIVATLEIQTPQMGENTIAWQRFMPNGPIAILPLNKQLSSLVWTTSIGEAKRLLEQPKEQFIDELNASLLDKSAQNPVLNGPLVSINVLLNALPGLKASPGFIFPTVSALPYDDRAAFPLSFVYAKDYIGHRVALIGDAAHRVHPLAGQGVNLGWSDVNNLTNALELALQEGGDIGSLTYLKEFDSRSQQHNGPVMTAIDSLNHLFSTNSAPTVLMRSLGFSILDRFMPVKDMIVHMAS